MSDITIAERIQRDRENLPDYVKFGEFDRRISGGNREYAFKKKYSHRDTSGEIVENPSEAIYRMALTMAEVEKGYGASEKQVGEYTREFFDMVSEERFSPAGRIWTNAGTEIGGLFNCYVLPVEDSLDLDNEASIYNSVANASVIHKNGGGTGYNFSELRPRGSFVQSSKGIASGPVSFIGQFDIETEIINSGNRRGANMGILDISHPDIFDFIYAKSRRGEITNFNVSIGATELFMRAVKHEGFYGLEFPRGEAFHYKELEQMVRNIEENKLGASGVGEEPRHASLKLDSSRENPTVLGKTKVIDSYSGEVAGRVNEEGHIEIYAPYIFDKIAQLAWETADPGMIFLDEINKTNPLPQLGPIKATNPCGEQPLHPYDACNLGSTILSNFVTEDFAEIDYEGLERTVITATRFMDNVNDANKGPIPRVEATIRNHRRIGMGVMGWADMLIKLRVPYDSQEGRDLARKVMGSQTDAAKRASVELAKEKEVFPAFEGSIYDTGKEEDRVRNIDRTTIAPTGTISMLYDVSSGIEPIFAVTWGKHIRGGDVLSYTHTLFAKECEKRGIDLDKILPLIEENHGSVQGIREIPKDMQRIYKTAHDISYEDHILMQAAFQEFTDNAVSKTTNMVNSSTVEDVKGAYLMAWENGLKGTTVYRDGCKEIQVLTTGHGESLEERASMDNPLKVPAIKPELGIRQATHFGNMHAHIALDPSRNYAPIEVFMELGNAGNEEPAAMEAYGRLTSLWLRSGGSLDNIIAQLKDIGSGAGVATRDGGVHSIPQGFARALMKFKLMRDHYDIGDILTGKVDYTKVEAEISDMLRTGKVGEGYESKRLPEEIIDEGDKGNKTSFSQRCPDCRGKLRHEEGCTKCSSCSYSTC